MVRWRRGGWRLVGWAAPGPPNQFLVSGVWPDGNVDGPVEARYALELSRRLRDAVGDRSLRDVARSARLDHTTISAVIAGSRWADLVTIARLEEALDARLWPEVFPDG